jgi:predicted Fe-Mo cluster-binding NifX family protein
MYFIILESDSMEYEALENPNTGATGGAGVSTAQLIAGKGISAVMTGRIGPNVHKVLSAAGVEMITGVSGKVRAAIEKFKTGGLRSTGEAQTSGVAGGGAGRGMGRGMGCGMGQGRGMGKGMGRGMGGGSGRGMKASQGFGNIAVTGSQPMTPANVGFQAGGSDEINLLKRQAQVLAEELAGIQRRLEEIESK